MRKFPLYYYILRLRSISYREHKTNKSRGHASRYQTPSPWESGSETRAHVVMEILYTHALLSAACLYRIAGNFRQCKFSYKQLKCLQQNFSYFKFSYACTLPCPLALHIRIRVDGVISVSVEAIHNGERVPRLQCCSNYGPLLLARNFKKKNSRLVGGIHDDHCCSR